MTRRGRAGHGRDEPADGGWTLSRSDDDPATRRVNESLLALGDGALGVRGSREEVDPDAAPLVLAAGVYAGLGPGEHLMAGPWPLTLDLPAAVTSSTWTLDLRSATLAREVTTARGVVRTLRFVHAGRRGLVVLAADGPPDAVALGPPIRQVTDRPVASGTVDGQAWARTVGEHGSIAACVTQRASRDDGGSHLERIAAFVMGAEHPAAPRDALRLAEHAEQTGFDELLAEHRLLWSRRWRDVDVEIDGDPEAQLAARFALFHLWNAVGGTGEAAVGARGISGPGYAGHVFWDADVFVLPAVVAMSPRAARAMLRYRIRRLPEARLAAAVRGLDGARFPWESASLGGDVTPTATRIRGEWVPILTGQLQEHIVGDVAWAAAFYADWTGDRDFLVHEGRPLLTETAHYWASRVAVDPDGTAHLRHVIGPDEYHEVVDDNCFTNVLARWNLRRAARLEPSQEAAWCRLADRLCDGFDASTHRHEQFTGFYALQSLLAADVATPPFAADVALGTGRVGRTQLIKQPDVLMAHHLLPSELQPGSLLPDLELYLPRTTHGSSLSPPVAAAVLARAGRPDDALALLRIALRLDLDDLTGMTASGVHLATMGGVWQALLSGFAGIRVDGGALRVSPRLPRQWRALRLRFRCLGQRVRLEIGHDSAELVTSGPISVATGHEQAVLVARRAALTRRGDTWVVAS